MRAKSGQQLIIYGAGGHAISVIDALQAAGLNPAYIIDDDPAKEGSTLAQVKVRSRLEDLSPSEASDIHCIVAIARNLIRKQVVQKMSQAGYSLVGVRHPTAIISPHADVDLTAQIMAGVIINAGAVIQQHAVLNTGCIVDHNSMIGAYTHIGPGAVLARAVRVEEGAFVATGAKVAPLVTIGCWSVLGAGAVALKDIPEHMVAVGVPAAFLRSNP